MVVMDSKDYRSEVYRQENCIGCGNCVAAYPKSALVTGSAAAIARGLIDKNFIEKGKECLLLHNVLTSAPRGSGGRDPRLGGDR